MTPRYICGLDLGQKHDYSAVAVALHTREMDEAGLEQNVVTLGQLDRVRQESYETVADGIANLLRRPELRDAALVVDETGVGVGVCDMLTARGLHPRRITITGGNQVTAEGGRFFVPKRDLILAANLQLEQGRLRIAPELPHAQTLIEELNNYKVKISLSGHDVYGAGTEWREGAHDDLVLATALVCWWAKRFRPTGQPVLATGPGRQYASGMPDGRRQFGKDSRPMVPPR